MHAEQKLAPTLQAQHGLVTRAQARAAGLSDGQVHRLLRSGQFHRVERSVYQHCVTPPTDHSRGLALCLATDGLASHRTAGALLGLGGEFGPPFEISVRKGRTMVRDGVRFHESTQMALAEPRRIDGIPCTGLLRTVLDLAAVVGRRRLERVVDAALRDKEIEWPDLYRVLVRHSRQGRDGCGKLRALLAVRYGERVVPDSAWNRMVAQLLVDAGLPAPEFEMNVTDGDGFVARVDLAYPELRIAVELDSVRWHLNQEAFESDRRKRNRLVNAGWLVLAFTWTDFVDDPATLCATVAQAIAERSGARPAVSGSASARYARVAHENSVRVRAR